MNIGMALLAIAFSFIIGAIFGAMAAFLSRRLVFNRQLRIAERRAARMVAEARNESKAVQNEAREEAQKIKVSADAEYRERRTELQRQENRLGQKGETLDRKLEAVEQRDRNLTEKEKGIESTHSLLEEIKDKQLNQLELISGMSSAEAKDTLLEAIEAEMQQETSRRLRDWEAKLKEESNEKAQEILSQAIQRSASDAVAETTVTVVPLPSDEMKGRLIGREGRNIRALEQATGVDLIIDDTPEAVTLSSFDPVRREVTRRALTKLILDGRIHPARIEELVAKTKEEVDADIITAGEQAAYQVEQDETVRFLELLRAAFSSGNAHIACRLKQEPPATRPHAWGWRSNEVDLSGNKIYKPMGDCIGWYCDKSREIWLERNSAYATVQKIAKTQGDAFLLSPASLWRRMYEKGLILSVEASGTKTPRLAVKRVIAGADKRVLILSADAVESEV